MMYFYSPVEIFKDCIEDNFEFVDFAFICFLFSYLTAVTSFFFFINYSTVFLNLRKET